MNSMNNQTNDQNDTILKTEEKLLQKKCKIIGIYGLRNKVDGKWYIGQSRDIPKRFLKYKNYNCKTQTKLYNALKKYNSDNFDYIILEICLLSQPELNEREKYWFNFYDCIKNGYNIREAGANGALSEETKIKISLGNIGKKKPKRTPIQIKNMSVAQIGKTRSLESRKKQSAATKENWKNRSREKSKTHCNKISISAKERYKDPTKNPNYGKSADAALRLRISGGVKLANIRRKLLHDLNSFSQITVVQS